MAHFRIFLTIGLFLFSILQATHVGAKRWNSRFQSRPYENKFGNVLRYGHGLAYRSPKLHSGTMLGYNKPHGNLGFASMFGNNRQNYASETRFPPSSLVSRSSMLSIPFYERRSLRTALTSRYIQSARAVSNCESFENQPDKCRANSCYYCCSDAQCYAQKSHALDCFTTGCRSFCGRGKRINQAGSYCTERGCRYQLVQNRYEKCYGPQRCDKIDDFLGNECIKAGCYFCCVDNKCSSTQKPGQGCTNQLFSEVAIGDGKRITLYEHINWLGDVYTLEGFEVCQRALETNCRNLPGDFSSKLSGIRTYGLCVEMFTDFLCKGTKLIAMGEVPDFVDTYGLEYNDKVKSISLC